MATAASGCISTSLALLKASLSNSANFKSWTSATTAAQALKRIHESGIRPPDEGREFTPVKLKLLRPYALVWDESGEKAENKIGAGAVAKPSGQFGVRLVWGVPDEIAKNPTEINIRMCNAAGDVIDDLFDMRLTSGRLRVRRIEWGRTRRYGQSKIVNQNEVVYKDLTVSW